MEKLTNDKNRSMTKNSLFMITATLVMLLGISFAFAETQTPVFMGTAADFGVLAGSAISNTGPTVIDGNLGVNPGLAISGFPPGIVNGIMYAGEPVSGQAQTDLTTAYNDAAGRTPALDAGLELGGQTLVPGVYNSGSSLSISSDLTLDAQGNPDAVFIFQAGSTLTTMSGTEILLINGADPRNVFWQVGSSATLGTDSVFKGTILAFTSITLTTGADLEGRALARNGAVTLESNNIYLLSESAANTTLTVNKIVVNNDGGDAVVSDFTYYINNSSVLSGIANEVMPGSYVISETGVSGYNSAFSGDCSNTGVVTVDFGQHKVCTITNNDIHHSTPPPPPPPEGVPEFSIFTLAIAVIVGGMGLAYLRKR